MSTLPRSRGAGLNSPLLYSRKKQFKRSVTSDALQSKLLNSQFYNTAMHHTQSLFTLTVHVGLPSHKSMDSFSSTSNSDQSLSDADPTNDEQQSKEQLNNDDELRDECSSPQQQEEREMVSPEIEERKNDDTWIMPHGGFEDSFEQQPLTLSSSIYIRHDSPATEGKEEGCHTEECTVLTQQVMEPGPAVILADNSVLIEEQGEQCNEDVPSLDSLAQPQEQPPPLDDEQHHHQVISVSTELSISKEEELPLASNEQIQSINGEGSAVSDEKMQSFGIEEESVPSADSDVVPVVELVLIPTDNAELIPEESATNAVSSSEEESIPIEDLTPASNEEESLLTNKVDSSSKESINVEPIPTSNEDILTDMTIDDTSSQLLEDNTPTNVETNDEETLSIEDNQVTHFNGNISIDKKHINDEESKTDRPLSNDNDLESPKELRSRNVAKSINLSTTIKESASTDDTPKWRDIDETVVVLKYGAAGILSNWFSSFSQQSLLLCLTIIGLVLFFIVMLSYNYFFYYRSGTA